MLHPQHRLGDQVRQPLGEGRLAIMLLRRGEQHRQPERPAQESRHPSRPRPPQRAQHDLQPRHPLPHALRPEQGMSGDQVDMRGQLFPQYRRRLDLHRPHVHHQRAGFQIRCHLPADRPHRRHRHRQYHDIAPTHLRQRRRLDTHRHLNRPRIMGQHRNMRRQILRHQPPEGAKADNAQAGPDRRGKQDHAKPRFFLKRAAQIFGQGFFRINR